MLHSGKKIRAECDKKKYSNSRVVRKKNSGRNKKTYPSPPSFWKLNGRFLISHVSAEVDSRLISLLHNAMLSRQIKPLIRCHYLIRYKILARYVYHVTSSKQFFITVYIISAPITYNYIGNYKENSF